MEVVFESRGDDRKFVRGAFTKPRRDYSTTRARREPRLATNLVSSNLARAPRRALGAGRGVETTTSTLGAMSSTTSSSSLTEEFVDADLLTPPLGLVALLGRSDLHPAVREALRSDVRPPLECLSSGDLADASRVIGARKRSAPPNPAAAAAALAAVNPLAALPTDGAASTPEPSSAPTPDDVASRAFVKSGWLAKHRQRRPAVALAFVPHESVEGDPNAWMALSAQLESVRLAAAAGDCKLAVVVVGDDAPEHLPEDRASAVRRQAQIEPRSLVTLSQPPTPDSLRRLSSLCRDLAREHYAREGQRQAARAHVSGEASAKPAFKAGAFAEFQGDWQAALRWYRAAHDAHVAAHALAAAGSTPGAGPDAGSDRPTQDLFRRMAAAERCHHKACALLLTLNPGQPGEAVEQMRKHAAAFKRPPAWLPRAALPEHARWVARQHLAFAESLSSRVPWGGTSAVAVGAATGAGPLPSPPPPGTPRAFLPGFYFHAAATATERRRRALEAAADAAASAPPPPPAKPGVRPGELARADDGGALTDDEYLRRRDADGPNGAALTRAIVELLTRAHDQYKRTVGVGASAGSGGGARLFASLTSRLASAYLHAGDFASARRLFGSVAHVYRREGWDDLLGTALMGLKECASRLKLPREHLEICLELAATGGRDADAAMAAAQAAMSEMGARTAPDADVADANTVTDAVREVAVPAGPARLGGERGLSRVLRCVASFPSERAVPGTPARFVAAVRSSLPASLPVASVAVAFTDPTYDWRATPAETNGGEEVPETLTPGTWHRVVALVTPRWGHPVDASAVVVTLVGGVRFRLALAGKEKEGGGGGGNGNGNGADPSERFDAFAVDERLPDAAADARAGIVSLNLRGAPPRMSLEVHLGGPALLGEACALPLAVVSTGDALGAAELAFTFRAGGDASGGGGDSASGDSSAAGTAVELMRDPKTPLEPGETISVGDIPPGGSWRGAAYVRWRRLGPPATLVVELRGRRAADGAGAGAGKSAADASVGSEVRTALETEVEVTVQAPFAVSRETTAEYRTHALAFDADAREPTRELSVVRVAAAGSRLAVADVRAPAESRVESRAELAPSVLDEGDEYLHVTRGTRGTAAKALEVTWRRVEGPETGEDARTTISTEKYDAVDDAVRPAATSDSKSPPLVVTLEAPAHVAAGHPFHLRVRCRNATALPQPLTVRVADAGGFVFGGARNCAVVAAPRATADLGYVLVPVTSGEMLLPELVVTATRYRAQLRPPRESRRVFVKPHA